MSAAIRHRRQSSAMRLLLVLMPILMSSGCGSRIGIDVSSQDANASVHQRFMIPDSSTKVRYVSSVRSSVVNAWISEAEFRKWARVHDWQIVEAEPGDNAMITLIKDDGSTTAALMSRGYRFHDEGRVGFGGAYDSEHGIASVTWFSR